MTLTASNAHIFGNGKLYVAPAGTTLPTTAAESLDAAFIDLGYISGDGSEWKPNLDVKSVNAWQKNAEVITRTSSVEDVTFSMLELKKSTWELYYDTTVTNGAGGSSVPVGNPAGTSRIFVADYEDGDLSIRYVAPSAVLIDRDSVKYSYDDESSWGVTLRCRQDDSGNAYYLYGPELDV